MAAGYECLGRVDLGRLTADRPRAARPEVDPAEIVRVLSVHGRPEPHGPEFVGGVG